MPLDLHREKTLLHHASRTGSVGRRHSISLVAAGGCWISLIHLGHQSLWRRHVAGGAQTLQANSGKIAAMARPQTARSRRRARDELTVSHRERLVEELLADLMKEAGLTHGGFYAHFESRDALLAAAADQEGAESSEHLTRAIAAAKPGQELMALVDAYLSDGHVAAPEKGCAIAAAGTEVPRQHADVRRAANRRIKDIIGLVERQLPEWGRSAGHDKAMGIAATLVGSVVLARAVDDAQLSKRIRKAARELVRTTVG